MPRLEPITETLRGTRGIALLNEQWYRRHGGPFLLQVPPKRQRTEVQGHAGASTSSQNVPNEEEQIKEEQSIVSTLQDDPSQELPKQSEESQLPKEEIPEEEKPKEELTSTEASYVKLIA